MGRGRILLPAIRKLNHGLNGYFLLEFVEIRVVNAQENLALSKRQRFPF